MHHTKDKGDLGLVTIIKDLVRSAWIVSLPISEHSPYDLIATKGLVIKRIQVKYRTVSRGVMTVPLRNSWGNIKKGAVRSERYSANDVDVFAVTNGEYIAYVQHKNLSDTGFSIRVIPSKNKQTKGCKFIADYASLV